MRNCSTCKFFTSRLPRWNNDNDYVGSCNPPIIGGEDINRSSTIARRCWYEKDLPIAARFCVGNNGCSVYQPKDIECIFTLEGEEGSVAQLVEAIGRGPIK